MRVLALLAALSIVFGAPNTAGAALDDRDEAYWAREALRTLCMKHRLDRDATLRQAEADGWRPLPEGEVPKIGGLHEVVSRLRLTGLSTRWKTSPRGGMVLLLLGDGGEAGPGCAIAYRGPFDTASSVIGGHFMLPVRRFETISPGYHLWAFVEEPGKRRRAVKSYFGKVDHALIASARARRTFSTLAVIGHLETGGVLFLYSVPPAPTRTEPPSSGG